MAPNLAITVPADGLAPNCARPLANTMLTAKLHMFAVLFYCNQWFCVTCILDQYTGIIMGMVSVKERRCYIVTHPIIGWAHTHNGPWNLTRPEISQLFKKSIPWRLLPVLLIPVHYIYPRGGGTPYMMGDTYVPRFWPPFLTLWVPNSIFLGCFFLIHQHKNDLLGTNPHKIRSFWTQNTIFPSIFLGPIFSGPRHTPSNFRTEYAPPPPPPPRYLCQFSAAYMTITYT